MMLPNHMTSQYAREPAPPSGGMAAQNKAEAWARMQPQPPPQGRRPEGMIEQNKAEAWARMMKYQPQPEQPEPAPQPQPQPQMPREWKAPMHGAAPMQAAPVVRATGAQAILFMQKQYQMLSGAGALLQQLTKARGKPLPCSLLDSYHRAVREYLHTGQQIIDAFAKQGITLRQVIFRGGKPVPDANAVGGVKSIWFRAPLRPPVFVTRKICPQITHLSGAPNLGNPLGVTFLGFLSILAISGAFVLGADKLNEAIVTWKSPDPGAAERFDAQQQCMQDLRAALGYQPAPAPIPRSIANTILRKCNIDPEQWSTMAIVGVVAVAGAAVGGGAWLYFKGVPALRARRERREEEREEAESLEREAAEKVKEARKLRKGRGRTRKDVAAEYFPPGVAVAGSGTLGACPCAL